MRDVVSGRIPVRNGKPVPRAEWPADGLAEAVLAAGLRLSPTRVEGLVRRCDNDSGEVWRQLGWWERRKKLWGTWKPASPERVFEKHCENRDLEPDDKPVRSTRPDSRTVDEVLGFPEEACHPEEWLAAHPEGERAWLDAESAKKRGQS